jgi:hypothetical protein
MVSATTNGERDFVSVFALGALSTMAIMRSTKVSAYWS